VGAKHPTYDEVLQTKGKKPIQKSRKGLACCRKKEGSQSGQIEREKKRGKERIPRGEKRGGELLG